MLSLALISRIVLSRIVVVILMLKEVIFAKKNASWKKALGPFPFGGRKETGVAVVEILFLDITLDQ